jgi:hypothetical protein
MPIVELITYPPEVALGRRPIRYLREKGLRSNTVPSPKLKAYCLMAPPLLGSVDLPNRRRLSISGHRRLWNLIASVLGLGTEANTRVRGAHREDQLTSTRVALTVPDRVNSTVLWSNSEPGTVGSNFDTY